KVPGIDTLGPTPPDQPFKTEEQLYDAAERAYEQFTQIIDMGHGVSSDLGASTHRTGTPEKDAAAFPEVFGQQDKSHILIADLKGRDRARAKVTNKYGGDWGQLTDVLRGTITVPH